MSNARQAIDGRREREVVTKATLRAGRIMGLNNAKMADVLGVSEASVSRMTRAATVLDGKPFELGLMLVRLYRGLAGILGSDDEAVHSWMRADNRALRGRPIDLIASINGLVTTVAYVDSRRAHI
ncbi:MAG: antitoxin Xre/MbcA/ParS toxin-binding domain-containing protein [Bacteroidales bacterium]